MASSFRPSLRFLWACGWVGVAAATLANTTNGERQRTSQGRILLVGYSTTAVSHQPASFRNLQRSSTVHCNGSPLTRHTETGLWVRIAQCLGKIFQNEQAATVSTFGAARARCWPHGWFLLVMRPRILRVVVVKWPWGPAYYFVRNTRARVRRCSKKPCNAFNDALLRHPGSVVGKGSTALFCEVQTELLFHAVWNTKPLHTVRAELGLNEKIMSNAYARWRKVLTVWVEHKQQTVQPGGNYEEGVEVVVRKQDVKGNKVKWTQYARLKNLGDRQSRTQTRRCQEDCDQKGEARASCQEGTCCPSSSDSRRMAKHGRRPNQRQIHVRRRLTMLSLTNSKYAKTMSTTNVAMVVSTISKKSSSPASPWSAPWKKTRKPLLPAHSRWMDGRGNWKRTCQWKQWNREPWLEAGNVLRSVRQLMRPCDPKNMAAVSARETRWCGDNTEMTHIQWPFPHQL